MCAWIGQSASVVPRANTKILILVKPHAVARAVGLLSPAHTLSALGNSHNPPVALTSNSKVSSPLRILLPPAELSHPSRTSGHVPLTAEAMVQQSERSEDHIRPVLSGKGQFRRSSHRIGSLRYVQDTTAHAIYLSSASLFWYFRDRHRAVLPMYGRAV